jgi:predicted alpha/beta-fold hydrolase
LEIAFVTLQEGDRTPVQAAASLCPAYDISGAFSRLSEQQPTVDRHILGSMKRLFLRPNEALLSAAHPAAWAACRDATTIHQFLLGHVAFAGCADPEQYFAEHNPMAWVGKVARPTLLLNSEDDIVCLAENIREDVVGSLPGALLLRTKRGSHIAYNEGLLGTGCYMSRITMDFLQAAREVGAEGEKEE